MKPFRLVLITRRFWPLVGGAEVVMGSLAIALRQFGVQSTILTAQWSKTWPAQCLVCDVPVVRLPQPQRRGWGTLRYMNAVSRWLRTHKHEIDVVYVSMLKHDAYAAVGSLAQTDIPVVLRAEGGGKTGDCHWQQTAKFGKRIRTRCQQADAFIAISPPIEQELMEAGYRHNAIHRIGNGTPIAKEKKTEERRMARQVLADVNPQLRVPPNALVAVFTGRFHRGKGLDELLRAWPRILRHWPSARLWLVGGGDEATTLHNHIRQLGLDNQVVLTGIFDSLDEILTAADLFVLPSFEEGMSVALLEAMASGLPTIVSDIPGNRHVVTPRITSILVQPGDHAELAQSIIEVWSQPEFAARMGAAARDCVRKYFSLESAARQHWKLFQQLATDGKRQILAQN